MTFEPVDSVARDLSEVLERPRLSDLRALTCVIDTPTPWEAESTAESLSCYEMVRLEVAAEAGNQPGLVPATIDLVHGLLQARGSMAARQAGLRDPLSRTYDLLLTYPDPGELIKRMEARNAQLQAGGVVAYAERLQRDIDMMPRGERRERHIADQSAFLDTDGRIAAYDRLLEILYGDRYGCYKLLSAHAELEETQA